MKFDLKIHEFLLMIVFFSCANHKENDLSLSPLFSDGMVLQRNAVVTIWGTTSSKKKVEIQNTNNNNNIINNKITYINS